MAVALQGYYDASGSLGNPDGREVIALAGYAAAPSVWDVFETEWWRVLADDSARPACRYLHMNEANALQGEFSVDRGWTHTGVQLLLADLFNRCFSPNGLNREFPDALVGASCWVDLGAYARVCEQYPHFVEKKPEALCVDHVVGIAIRQLCPVEERVMWGDLLNRRQSIELFFDRQEPFRHHIQRVWEALPWHRRSRPLKLVSAIASTDRESSAAIQAADYLAWHTNRDLSSEPGDLRARLMAWFSARCYPMQYDYDELLKTAARWRSDGGYDAETEHKQD